MSFTTLAFRPAETATSTQVWNSLRATLYAACSSGVPNAAGIVQVKRLTKAWRAMEWELNSYNTPEGTVSTVLYPGVRKETPRLVKAIDMVKVALAGAWGGPDWQVTKKNAAAITKALQGVTAALAEVRPMEGGAE